MQHEFQFTFQVDFIKAALRRDFLWKGYLLAGLLLAMALGCHLSYGLAQAWLSLILIAMAGFVVLRFRALPNTFAKRIFDLWSKQAPNGIVKYELDDEGFSVVLEASRSRFEWKGLRKLWRY